MFTTIITGNCAACVDVILCLNTYISSTTKSSPKISCIIVLMPTICSTWKSDAFITQ